MSVLVIRPANVGLDAPRCTVPSCGRSPRNLTTIAGYPAGRVCAVHAREWRRAWDDATSGASAPAAPTRAAA